MPPRPTLKIVEIFPSVQGEGLRQGDPTIFIRLAGCNLRCAFCDTKRARRGGRSLPVDEILLRIGRLRRSFPAEWVCLTGGEPFLQDIRPLVRLLKRAGFKVQVETNGTLFRPLAADWLTVSPKPGEYACDPRFKKKATEVKVVVTRGLGFEMVKRLRGDFPPGTPLILQPLSNARWSMVKGLRLQKRALRMGLTGIKVSVQLHKIYRLP